MSIAVRGKHPGQHDPAYGAVASTDGTPTSATAALSGIQHTCTATPSAGEDFDKLPPHQRPAPTTTNDLDAESSHRVGKHQNLGWTVTPTTDTNRFGRHDHLSDVRPLSAQVSDYVGQLCAIF